MQLYSILINIKPKVILELILGFYLLCSLLLMSSCANIQDITGGPEDLKPPVLIKELSSPDKQLYFSAKMLEFHFDEWIRLDNPVNHIKISPSTVHPLQYKLKGKKLMIFFDEKEDLHSNTTYTLYFGACIKDITKSNVLQDLKYVFSTGSYIDSLSISGHVYDAFTREPKDKILIALYSNLQDSAIETEKPLYYTWSNKEGKFSLENISDGNYNLFALLDKNQNYKLDARIEEMAFLDSSLNLTGNNIQNLTLWLNEPMLPLLIKEKVARKGYSKIVYNRSANQIDLISSLPDHLTVVYNKDSVCVWNGGQTEELLIVSADQLMDTLKCLPMVAENESYKFSVKFMSSKLFPGESPVIESSIPITKINTEKIVVLDSLNKIDSVIIDPRQPQKIKVMGQFIPVQNIQIKLEENALINRYGLPNKSDTLSFSIYDPKSLSSLLISLDSFPLGQSYLIELINDLTTIKTIALEINEQSVNYTFNALLPGKYRLRIIEDNNDNGIWDRSDFVKKIQAENIKYYPLPELRANWDVNAKIKYTP